MKRFTALILIAVMLFSAMSYRVFAGNVAAEELMAQELRELGLFKGVSDTNFDLYRPPSRIEAVVMLIRLLGKENDAVNDIWRHPFSDVPAWADNYVGYAYSKGLTNGQSTTEFGTGNASAAMYVTFILRALGYSDTNGQDFLWSDPFTLAKTIGIIDNEVNLNDFQRADAVKVSHAALSAYIKGSGGTLAEKLISANVFSEKRFKDIYNSHKKANEVTATEGKDLTAEEIYAKCAPMVFYIEIYDKFGNATASGSGFFIEDSGVAVTNYHVIEGGYSAYAYTTESEKLLVIGVLDYSKEEDWAVLQIQCNDNEYLKIGDCTSITGGSKVYAIGSPLGLQNTISEGIVSNPARNGGAVNYIQITTPISHGSSGGALINSKGEVIGITSAGFSEGQNLNLAIPMTYLSGYKTETITPLIVLYNRDPEAKKNSSRQALLHLHRWGLKNGHKDSIGYTCSTLTDDGLYEIRYKTEFDNLFLWFSNYDDNMIPYEGFINLSTYGYCVTYGNTLIAGYLDEATHTETTSLTFDEYVGDVRDRVTMIRLARLIVNDLLQWADWYLDKNEVGIDIGDLGFTAFGK